MRPHLSAAAFVLAALLTTLFSWPAHAQTPAPAKKPNILFIAVDDLNTRIGCYGDKVTKTPHIDKLAGRAMRFDRAYCQYPLCNPTRASLLTGRRPDTTQVYGNTRHFRETLPDVVTLPQLFQKGGYVTARTGKIFHNILDDKQSWDIGGEPPIIRPKQKPGAGDYWKALDAKDETQKDSQTATEANGLLDRLKEKPFFLAVGFAKPHVPLAAPKAYFDLYDVNAIPLPPAVSGKGEDLSQIPKAALRANFDLFRARTATPAEAREAIEAYHACTSFMDAQVGRVLDHLDKLGLRESTIVVFWGDHGWHLGEHGLWSKMSLFEESARVPLLIATPGGKKSVTARLAEFVDIYPTLGEMAGLPLPEGLEGSSLVPLLSAGKRAWKKAAFTQVQGGGGMGRAVRTERFRYIEWEKTGEAQLYDHDTDPQEYVNLAKNPEHAATVAEMKRLLKEGWRAALPPASTAKADPARSGGEKK